MNILTNSDVFAGLSQGHFLSPTGGCKTWDEGADGYCRSGLRAIFHYSQYHCFTFGMFTDQHF